MTDQIISVAMIEAKARSAYARGVERDGHEFNPGAPAIEAWQAEWDRCNKALRHMVVERVCTRRVSPP